MGGAGGCYSLLEVGFNLQTPTLPSSLSTPLTRQSMHSKNSFQSKRIELIGLTVFPIIQKQQALTQNQGFFLIAKIHRSENQGRKWERFLTLLEGNFASHTNLELCWFGGFNTQRRSALPGSTNTDSTRMQDVTASWPLRGPGVMEPASRKKGLLCRLG